MGAREARHTLEIGQGGINVVIDIINEAERIVRLYRQKNWEDRASSGRSAATH